MAVTVTVPPVGTVAGEVYRPEVFIVPTTVLPPVTPPTCHVTVVSVAFVTVAMNCWVAPPARTVAGFGLGGTGLTVTLIGATDTTWKIELISPEESVV